MSERTSHNPQTVRCCRKCVRPFPFFGLMPISQILALSACHTGTPNIRTGIRKYITIIAVFFFPGSRNVLGRLCAANHISAAIFRIGFYETLLGEKHPPVGLALKQTQEWMREAPVAELLEWIGGCRLMREGCRQEMCYDPRKRG
ncbi:CHAT domain-containing protein [Kamptonema formosum]|uniref:CHAT domain-containing protein n=1 Tax=Kamptonema formosum TaxID=331992 RepID=UPI0018E20759|nr:CHAT domain-containing protein [Oscillatoria sp. PCC 10802]